MSRRSSSSTSSRSSSKFDISEPELLPNCASSPANDFVIKNPREEHFHSVSLSSNLNRRSTTPIIFSQTTVRRKPPVVEKKLQFTLEELCFGCVKKIKVTRDAIKDPGYVFSHVIYISNLFWYAWNWTFRISRSLGRTSSFFIFIF